MSDESLFSGCCPQNCASCPGCAASGSQAGQELPRTITLTLEDDSVQECAVLMVFQVEGREYIALMPLDEDGSAEPGNVYIYGFARGCSGEPVLSNIEGDDEFDKAAEAFNEIVENARLVAEADPEE